MFYFSMIYNAGLTALRLVEPQNQKCMDHPMYPSVTIKDSPKGLVNNASNDQCW